MHAARVTVVVPCVCVCRVITLQSGKCSEHARTVGVVVCQGIDITQSHGRFVA